MKLLSLGFESCCGCFGYPPSRVRVANVEVMTQGDEIILVFL